MGGQYSMCNPTHWNLKVEGVAPDSRFLQDYFELILFGLICGTVLITLTAAFLGRKAAAIGIAIGVLVICAWFFCQARPIEMGNLRGVLTSVALNTVREGVVWVVVARGATWQGMWQAQVVG